DRPARRTPRRSPIRPVRTRRASAPRRARQARARMRAARPRQLRAPPEGRDRVRARTSAHVRTRAGPQARAVAAWLVQVGLAAAAPAEAWAMEVVPARRRAAWKVETEAGPSPLRPVARCPRA